jgi:hypothetical protein
MNPAKIVRRASLGLGHLRTGNTRHYRDGELVATPVSLIVVEFGPDQYNLIHLDEAGKELTDTFHESIEDAFRQAAFEFRVSPGEWLTVEEPYN